MTAQTPKDASESPGSGAAWLSVSEASARCGISTKTLRKRMASGAVNFRRVSLARGGAAYEVEMETVLEGSKPKFQTGVQTDREKFQTDARNGKRFGTVSSVKSTGMESGLEVEMESSKPVSKPMPESSISTSISSEREAELKEEIQFLRGVVESDRRDMAELRAALRKALDNAPKQLTIGAAETAPATPAISPDEVLPVAAANEPQTAPERDEPTTYGELADWLEKEMR